jgi:hypothetical protein
MSTELAPEFRGGEHLDQFGGGSDLDGLLVADADLHRSVEDLRDAATCQHVPRGGIAVVRTRLRVVVHHLGERADHVQEEAVLAVVQLDDIAALLDGDRHELADLGRGGGLLIVRRAVDLGQSDGKADLVLEDDITDFDRALVGLAVLHLRDISLESDVLHGTPCNPCEHSQPIVVGRCYWIDRHISIIKIIKSQDYLVPPESIITNKKHLPTSMEEG